MSSSSAVAINPRLDLLWEIVKRDLRSRNRRTILGVFWVILGPLLATSVIVLSLSGIFAGQFGSLSDYAVYTLSGVVFVQFTSFALIGTANSVLSARGIVTKMATPALLFPYAAIISALISWLVSTGYLIVMNLVVSGRLPDPLLLVALPSYALFLLGVGLMVAAIHTRYEDVGTVLPWLIQGLLFLTPVFYSSDIWPPAVRNILVLNPIYWYLLTFRSAVGVGDAGSTMVVALSVVAAVSVAAIGVGVHVRAWPRLVRAL